MRRCANRHHETRWWQECLYRGMPAVVCNECGKFIGYKVAPKQEDKHGRGDAGRRDRERKLRLDGE